MRDFKNCNGTEKDSSDINDFSDTGGEKKSFTHQNCVHKISEF